MTNNQKSQGNITSHIDQRIKTALELLVRLLGLVNGTITIHARGGQICHAIEVVNKVDMSRLGR